MKDNSTTTQNEYLIFIVKSMHMNIASFMHNLSYGDTYESLIYKWTIQLYEKGIPKEQGLKIIYRARWFALKHPDKKNNTPKPKPNLPEPLLKLKANPTYKRLPLQIKKQVLKQMELSNYNKHPITIDTLLKNISSKSPRKKRNGIFSSWFF